MKTINITYWTTTALLALLSIASAYGYLTQTKMQENFTHLGFPDYFRVELAVAKIVGAICLVIPVSTRCKEWTYAGFAIIYLSAFVAHSSMADPFAIRLFPLLALVLLTVSHISYQKRLLMLGRRQDYPE